MSNYCGSSEHYHGGSVEANFDSLTRDGRYSRGSVLLRGLLGQHYSLSKHLYFSIPGGNQRKGADVEENNESCAFGTEYGLCGHEFKRIKSCKLCSGKEEGF